MFLVKHFIAVFIFFLVNTIETREESANNVTTKNLEAFKQMLKDQKMPSVIINPDFNFKTMGQLVTDLGYPVESYEVQTSDGYILGLFRIPNGKNPSTTKNTTKPVVFLQHGILGSSTSYVSNYYADQNLGTILADLGYDVWLGNFRGNSYSQKHATLSRKDPKFWQFNIDDLSSKDLPAMMDFALSKSGSSNLSFVGHSLGGGAILAFLSNNKTYQSKINLFVGLSPAPRPYWSPLETIPATLEFNVLKVSGALIGPEGEFYPNLPALVTVLGKACEIGILNELLCVNFYGSPKNLNKTRIPFLVAHLDESSFNVYNQYLQEIKAEKFQMYDYGEQTNVQKYGQKVPPENFPQNISIPVGLFSSLADKTVTQQQVQFLRDTLPNIVADVVLNETISYTHTDAVLAVNAKTILYPLVTALLDKYKNM